MGGWKRFRPRGARFLANGSLKRELRSPRKTSRRNLVRSSGFEPPRYCYRQPLKLVRLPVPPRRHEEGKPVLENFSRRARALPVLAALELAAPTAVPVASAALEA